jgi:site-specific DNA-cytosine methylase
MLESECGISTDRQCDNRHHETDRGGQNEPIVLGWSRDSKGNVVDRHPVEVANCVTAAKRDNTSNYVVEQNEPINVDAEGNAKCLKACYFKAGAVRGHKQMQYRIRKLTERECFRLMGVKDEDSDKIRSVVSKSQCYKLAGNSIVVDVMVHMFDQLFFGNKNTNQQLELF